MFLGNDVVDFINKIINCEDSQNQNKLKNIEEFSNYLRLTKMADEETLKCVDKIINCLPEILKLKEKIGYFDVNTILNEEKEKIDEVDQKKAKQIVKVYEEKHYHHYHDNSSSPCGSSSYSTSSSCGSTSSSCGSSGYSRSGC